MHKLKLIDALKDECRISKKEAAIFFASDLTFAIKFIIIDDHMLSGRSYETYPSGLPLIG